LPALREDLGTSVSGLQWVVDGYLLMFASLLLSGGVLADRIGARQVFSARVGPFRAGLGGVRAGPDHGRAGDRQAGAGCGGGAGAAARGLP
ncbi:MAG: MFS transporter, partial [Candidatus Dormibacteria bacterium]